MKIICDDKIPYIRQALESIADEIVYLPGADITNTDVRDADAIIVRTRTHCDAQLLSGSSVQLVVTATIGYDHIDTQWLEQAGINWTNCPGCNATSVAQWVRTSLQALQQDSGLRLADATLAIIGYGHVGHAVAEAMQPLVAKTIISDPPLFGEALPYANLPLQQAVENADIITFHTPLTHDGDFPTWHIADENLFSKLRRPVTVINAARGGVIDEAALLRAMSSGHVSHAIIDTWEGEPHINPELLDKAYIATPHIAGYSADGKANASRMAAEAVAQHFNILCDTSTIVPPPPPSPKPYDPRTDSEALKRNPLQFEYLRGNYPIRRE